jgi:hypothetical protein
MVPVTKCSVMVLNKLVLGEPPLWLCRIRCPRGAGFGLAALLPRVREWWSGAGRLRVIQLGDEGVEHSAKCGGLLTHGMWPQCSITVARPSGNRLAGRR